MNPRRLVVLALVALAALALFARARQPSRHPEARPENQHMADNGQDSFCERLLSTKPHREAKLWMAEQQPGGIRTIGEQSQEDSRAIVETLYALGAVDVQAIDIQVEPEGETCNDLIVTLPQHPEQRKQLFAFEAKVGRAGGFDPVADNKQRYMFLHEFSSAFKVR